MPRLARIVVPGMPHHVTQRGNRRQQTFFCDDDYRAYLATLGQWASRCDVRVLAYCLMPNHVHLILVPADEEGLARAVGETHRRYTLRINSREDWRGYLWQGRFASCVMDDPHLLAAAAYVERNPVTGRLVERAEEWAWSSAALHALGRPDAIAEQRWLTERTDGWICTWREYLARDEWAETARQLRRCESTGRPVGDATFLQTVGQLLGRDLTPKKRGRKPFETK